MRTTFFFIKKLIRDKRVSRYRLLLTLYFIVKEKEPNQNDSVPKASNLSMS